MLQSNDADFNAYVAELLQQHKGQRVLKFEYQQQSFWLKQPERLTGIWRFLKPQPQKAFHQELAYLRYLIQQGAPVPNLSLFGEDFLVLADVGKTLSYWTSLAIPNSDKLRMLEDGVQAIINLHQKQLTHGRPAMRDIIWRDGEVHFIDFESRSEQGDLAWRKVRDILLFIHSMYREDELDDDVIEQVIRYYSTHGDQQIWQQLLRVVKKYRCLYYILLPFKPIAKRDLIGVLKLFRTLLSY